MAEAKGMKFAQWVKGTLERLAMRRAVHRAKELMEKKCLTTKEKKERDTLVTRIGKAGNSREHALLRGWAVSGELHCRPEPLNLAYAISLGGYDETHLKMLRGALATGILCDADCPEESTAGRNVPMEEQYYLALILGAESGFLLNNTVCKNSTILALLEQSSARLAAFIELQMPGMVENLKREMEA